MNLTRQNTFWFCNTPLEKDNSNQLTFGNTVAQYNYFLSKAVKTVLNCSYIRKPVNGENKRYLSVSASIESLNIANYIMYKNSNSSKYYFAYIDRLEYHSDTVTHVYLTADSFQNWQFDIEFKQSFIERQTPWQDYANCLADDVAHGQLVQIDNCNYTFRGGYFVFCSSDITQDNVTESIPYKLQMNDFTIPCWVLFFPSTESSDMNRVLQLIAEKGRGDRILACVYIPLIDGDWLASFQQFNNTDVGSFQLITELKKMNESVIFEPTIPDGIKEKELTYPYAKIVVQDVTTGQQIELAPEKFAVRGQYIFDVRTFVSEKPHYRVTPKNYEGQGMAYNHSLVVNCDTTLPIANNLYAKYLMTNRESNSLARFNAYAGLVGSAISGGMGSFVGAGGTVLSTYNQLQNIAIKENQAGMLGSSVTSITDGAVERINFGQGLKISLYMMDSNHKEVARSYWNMFGYPEKRLGTPNINGNAYNFVKLAVPNIVGDNVPQDELIEIKNLFYNGVTLWHDPNSFLQY